MLWFVVLLNYLDRQVIFSLLSLLRRDLAFSDTQLGLLATSFLWIYAAASLAAGFAAARLGARRLILLSLTFWSAVTLLTALARNPMELLAARAVMGLSEAFYLPAALSLVAEFHADNTRGRASALHQSGIYAGIILGGVFGGWAGEHFGWRVPFFVLGGIGLLYTPFLAWALPATPPARSAVDRASTSFASVLRIPGFPAMTAVFALCSMAGWVVVTWTSLYLYERFGMGLALAGFALAAMTAYGIGRGLYDANIMPLLCLTARPEQRAPGYGVFNFAGTFSGGVTSLGAGLLKSSIGLDGALRWSASLFVIAALLMLRPIRRSVSAQPRP